MGTPYGDIYDRFLSKVNDYSLSSLPDDLFDSTLLKYLKNAIPEFKYCLQDLSDRDDTNATFNIDLTEQEQSILTKFMVVEWLTSFVNRESNLKLQLGNRDYQTFSSANLLKSLSDTRDIAKREADSDMNFYYYATY